MAAELSVVTERLPKSQVVMNIEVPAEVVDATYDRVLNRLASRAKIEGFRPGRAPLALGVPGEMLERRLDDLREPLAEITPVEREVRQGDIAVIDIEVEVDGTVVESESRKSTEAEVKEGVLLPELVAVLPGTFLDETREAKVTFPDSYSNPDLAGKDAAVRVTVRGVKEKLLPPLDDALAKSLTNGKQETAEACRQAV